MNRGFMALGAAVAFLATWLVPHEAAAQTQPASWSAACDFNLDTLTERTWQYGVLINGEFVRYPRSGNRCGQLGTAACGAPLINTSIIANNGTTELALPGSLRIPPNMLTFATKQRSLQAVQWVAPQAATYIITGEFQDMTERGDASPRAIGVVIDGVRVAGESALSEFGYVFQFNLTRSLEAGATVYFVYSNSDKPVSGSSRAMALRASILRAPS